MKDMFQSIENLPPMKDSDQNTTTKKINENLFDEQNKAGTGNHKKHQDGK